MKKIILFIFKICHHLNRIGRSFRTKLYLLQFSSAGKNISIFFPVVIEGKDSVKIGNNTGIGSFTHIWGNGGVEIGDNVLIASHCCISSLNHNYNAKKIIDGGCIAKKVIIENDVWLGYNVTILPGVSIGQGSVIGAGSVVVSSIPPYSIAVGNPAKVVKKRLIIDK
jgi:acetyltransferase-like isoleucine patch superfamily enzyme